MGREERVPAVVIMAGRTVRTEQVSATRQLILTTAERLFAEHGVYAVSNRQVSEAAGQGNNAAVGYHFGTKSDLVRAIAQRHSERVEALRARQLAALGDSAELRDWVDCLVRPQFDHLAALGSPTWYARFCAQVMTDPALREIMTAESRASSSLREIVKGRDRCMPALPGEVRAERGTWPATSSSTWRPSGSAPSPRGGPPPRQLAGRRRRARRRDRGHVAGARHARGRGVTGAR